VATELGTQGLLGRGKIGLFLVCSEREDAMYFILGCGETSSCKARIKFEN
jgi:hypothetical protein